jgi:hypothetical protein
MKNLLAVLLLFPFLLSAQSLQKGNILGVHQAEVQLKEGVTLESYVTAWQEQIFPGYQAALKGVEIHGLIGLSGACKNCAGFILIVESREVRNKYWKEDGNWTEYGLQKLAALQPAMEAMEKLGSYTSTHTDWLVEPSVDEYRMYGQPKGKE